MRAVAGRGGRLLALVIAGSLVGCTGARSGSTEAAGHTTSSQPSPRSCPSPVIPAGRYEKTITANDPVDPFLMGRWVMEASDVADPNCYYPLSFTEYSGGKVIFTDAHPDTIEPPWVVLHGNGEVNAHYRIVVHGRWLTWRGGRDDAPTRRSVLQTHSWRRIS